MITILMAWLIPTTWMIGGLVSARSEYADVQKCKAAHAPSGRTHHSTCNLSQRYLGHKWHCDCSASYLRSILWPLWFTLGLLIIASYRYVTRPVKDIPDLERVYKLERELGIGKLDGEDIF